jgi:hypothetical protein
MQDSSPGWPLTEFSPPSCRLPIPTQALLMSILRTVTSSQGGPAQDSQALLLSPLEADAFKALSSVSHIP